MAIDRLPSGRFRGRLMVVGKRYTATLPTEDDARLWEIQARADDPVVLPQLGTARRLGRCRARLAMPLHERDKVIIQLQ